MAFVPMREMDMGMAAHDPLLNGFFCLLINHLAFLMELIVEDGFGFWDISRHEITEVGVRLVLVKVLSVGSTRSLVFVMELQMLRPRQA